MLFLCPGIFFFRYGAHRDLHSFPTRRSSDLLRGQICHCEHFHPEVAAHSDSEQNEPRSEERFSRNAETDLVCRLLLEKKKKKMQISTSSHLEPRWILVIFNSACAYRAQATGG